MSLCAIQMIIITSFVSSHASESSQDPVPDIDHSESHSGYFAIEADEYNVLHFRNLNHYRDLWKDHQSFYSDYSFISHQHQQLLRSETIPIDCSMTSINMSLSKNKVIKQILAPFLTNSDDDKVRIFKHDDVGADKSFVIFEIGNQKITQWMEEIRSTFPSDERFHTKKVSWAEYAPAFQPATVCTDMELMRNEYKLIQAQLDVVIKAHQMLSNNSDPAIRYLTHWIDITTCKWLQKNVYGSNSNLSLSQIKDIIETQSIHTDAPYDLTFTLFITSDNYQTVNGSNSHEQVLAIFPAQMLHFIQYVNVNHDETVHNVWDERDRIWRLSSVMQTVVRNTSTTLNDMIHI
eukprot:46644_1